MKESLHAPRRGRWILSGDLARIMGKLFYWRTLPVRILVVFLKEGGKEKGEGRCWQTLHPSQNASALVPPTFCLQSYLLLKGWVRLGQSLLAGCWYSPSALVTHLFLCTPNWKLLATCSCNSFWPLRPSQFSGWGKWLLSVATITRVVC